MLNNVALTVAAKRSSTGNTATAVGRVAEHAQARAAKTNWMIVHLIVASILMPAANSVADQQAAGPASAITSGRATVAVRYRYENVDQDGFAEDANASTLRLRLNYRTGRWNGWSAFAEFDHISHVLLRDFNSGAGTRPNRAAYPVVADPKGADLNQLYFEYSTSRDWRLRVGRQRIVFDNHRFVGNVGWRQNEQTFDGLNLTTQAIKNTVLSYTYVDFVRRIFGSGVAAGRHDVDAHLLHADVTLNGNWLVVPYIYYIDNDDAASSSTSTVGARLTGKVAAGRGNLSLVVEYAIQSDAGNAPLSYDAQYLNVGAMWAMQNGLSLGLGFESLGGDPEPDKMFRTPFATLHAFQGWADQFLTTPDAGIDDLTATLKYRAGKWNLTAVYHDFSAATGSTDYGTEFDVSAGRRFAKHYSVLFKGAFFQADAAAFADTSKIWIMLTAKY